MTRDQHPEVTDLRARQEYKPDLAGLACNRLAAAREQAGLSADAFAVALKPLLGWSPTPDLVRTWESSVAPPGQVFIACEVIAAQNVRSVLDNEVVSAAQEADAEQSQLLAEPGAQSLDALWSGSTEIARAANRSPQDLFSAAHRIRSGALVLAGKTLRPAALADLYVITGQATALMASTAFDLDRWDESATLARSAASYADLGGSSSLQAWTLGLSALLANWRNEPDTALRHFRRGMEVAPPGTPRVRLRYIAARSYALLGDISSVGEVLDQARRDQDDAEHYRDSLSDETGGEFAFAFARAAACEAAAWLDIEQGREARDAAERALSALSALRRAGQSASQVAGTRIDLAAACLLEHDRDQAEDVLGSVFAMPSALRNVSLAGRLARVRTILTSRYWQRDQAARQLNDTLGEWLAKRHYTLQLGQRTS